ncbi:MAG: HdeD family acid-resistance protein [Dietzia sp.]
MSTSTAARSTSVHSTFDQASKALRLALIIGGLVAIGFGIAVLVWPAKTAVAITGVLAFYAIIAGVVYASIGVLAKSHGTGSRVGHVLLGLLYVVAGAYAFASLEQSAAFLAVFITVMIGVMWIIEGFTALFTLGESGAKGVTIVFAIISVIAGVSLLSTPVWGAGFLWWLLGISLIVLGALNVFRAMSARNSR